MTTIDKVTGLPEVPKGMFWRITRPNIIGHHEVQLRRKMFIGSSVVGYTQTLPSEMTPDRIRKDAMYVLRTFERSGMGRRFVGNYPPKKLVG